MRQWDKCYQIRNAVTKSGTLDSLNARAHIYAHARDNRAWK